MIHVKHFHREIKQDGTLYVWVGRQSFLDGKRYCWRCTFRSADGREIVREYFTGRVLLNGELVIEGASA